jgi:hypothetical protein
MKKFNGKITLSKNSRGCYIIDTVKGCSICRDTKPLGCYDNCYALSIANRYGIDFTEPVLREVQEQKIQPYLFEMTDDKHLMEICKEIKSIDMPFIRIGEMGDPSENWEHTINVCKQISYAKKPIVIITKHWKTLSIELLDEIKSLDICINTSVSPLDSNDEIHHRLEQYNRLKQYCKSVLRIVTCDFNIYTQDGLNRQIMQEYLMKNPGYIETVFRPNANNRLVLDKVINVESRKFLGSTMLVSMRDKNTFIGYCKDCNDMCGINRVTKDAP